VTLRVATVADAALLAEAHAEAFDPGWSATDLAQFLEDHTSFAIVAEAERAGAAGFILCRVIAAEAEVLTLAVRPALQRRGIGGSLVAAAMGVAAPRAEAMFLEVAADNPGAMALYERAGFEAVGRRAGYYSRPVGGGVDAIVMRRTLNT